MAEAPDRETGWSLRECTHALGGLRRLDPLFLGGAFWGGRRRAVGGLIEAGGLKWWRRLPASPTRGSWWLLLYDRTMESQDPGVAGGLRSGETVLGGGSSGARCLPRSPHSLHRASALSGYGPLGEALRSTRARGSGRRLSRHFSGKGLLSKWITPTTPGAGSGDPPPTANPQRNPR